MIEKVDLGGMYAIRGYRIWNLCIRPLWEPLPELARKFPGAFFEPELRGVIYPAQWSLEFAAAACHHCPEPYRAQPIHGLQIVSDLPGRFGASHRHGWYAFASFRLAMDYLACLLGQWVGSAIPGRVGWVAGTCLLAGKIVRADMGYRASHAAVEAVFGPDPGAIWVLRPVFARGEQEVLELLRHPPIVEMDWPWEADYPVWVVRDFLQYFDQALLRVRGEIVRIARRGKALERSAGDALRYWSQVIL